MNILEKIATVIYATFCGPVLEDSGLRISFRHTEAQNYLERVREYIGTDRIKVKEMYSPRIDFPYSLFEIPMRGRTTDLEEAIDTFSDWASEMDGPMDAFDIHPATFAFGKKGYCLVSESTRPNGEIVPEIMRMYIVPASQN